VYDFNNNNNNNMAVKRGHWMIRVLIEWMSHGTIASDMFSGF